MARARDSGRASGPVTRGPGQGGPPRRLRRVSDSSGSGRTAPAAPVVGMVGGGQLARMTAAAAVGLGIDFRVLAASRRRERGPGHRGHRARRLPPGRRPAGLRPRLRRGHVRPRARAAGTLIAAMEQAGTAVRPGAARAALRPGQAGHARAAHRPGRRAARGSRRCATWPRWRRSPSRAAGRSCSRRSPAATTAGASGSARRPAQAGGRAGRTASALIAEEHVAVRARAGRPGRPVAERPGRRLPGRADRPAGRHLPRGAGARRPAWTTEHGRRGRAARRCGIAAELDVTGLLAVELFETDGGLLVNELAMRPHNSGHWTIEGAADLAVRAAPAGRARPAARRTAADRRRPR